MRSKFYLRRLFVAGLLFISTFGRSFSQDIYGGRSISFFSVKPSIGSGKTSGGVYFVDSASKLTLYIKNYYSTNSSTGACTFMDDISHIRLIKNPGLNGVPAGQLVSPPLEFGLRSFSFADGRGKMISLFYRTDTLASGAITDPAGVPANGWVFLDSVTAGATCGYVTVDLNSYPAVNKSSIRRIAFANHSGATAGAGGSDKDVDSLVFISNVPIAPVKFAGISVASSNGFNKVYWSNVTEINTHSYVIEKSVNGINFSKTGEVAATNARSYSWIDNAVTAGVSFYRVKAIDRDGSLSYSSVVKISGGKGRSEFIIAPNLVRGRNLNIQLNNIARGTVELRVSNNAGQVVYRNSINNNEAGSSMSKTLPLPGSLPGGIYRAQIFAAGSVWTQTVVLQ